MDSKWNYKGYETELNGNYYGDQTDWNETIVTKFNQLSIDTNGHNTIRVPNKFKQIINNLVYYSQSTNKINERYNIEFIETDENIIYVGENKLEILNY
jgi:hypothetical protein